MIVRVWRGQTTPENADGYQRHVTEDVFAKLADITGHRGSCLLKRVTDGHVEFVAVTLWDSLDEIRQFAGSDPAAAVVEPAARAVLSSFDEVVKHYELAFSATRAKPGVAMSDDPDRSLVTRLMDGYLSTQLLYVAAQLRLADLLRDGPRSSAELAAATSATPSALHRVLRGLVLDGALDEDSDGRFRLTEAGRLLDSDRADSMWGAVMARGELYYQAAGSLIETVRRGGPAFHHAHGIDFFDALAARPDGGAAFHASMTARSQQETAEIVRAYDFSPFKHVVDVGGGRGLLLSAILEAHPHVHGTLFDRPQALAHVPIALEAAGVVSRCALAPGDFFSSVPVDGDLYVLSRVLHDWDDDAATHILRSCRRAMADNARLLIAEAVLPERARDNSAAIRMDLHMLTLLNGKERTLVQFEQVLRQGGFHLTRVIPVEGRTGITLLEGQPVSTTGEDPRSATQGRRY